MPLLPFGSPIRTSDFAISYGTATPTNGVDTPSHLYYDTDDSTLYVYVNGVWYPITGGSTPSTGTDAPLGLIWLRNLA